MICPGELQKSFALSLIGILDLTSLQLWFTFLISTRAKKVLISMEDCAMQENGATVVCHCPNKNPLHDLSPVN